MRYLLVLLVLLGGLVPCRAQNLLPNPEFDHDVSGWSPPPFYTHGLSWDRFHSAFGLGGSALLSLPFGAALSTSACVPVKPGVTYAWGGQYMFQTAVPSQFVQFTLTWTTDTNCVNGIANVDLLSNETPPGQWRILFGQSTAPAGAAAVLFTAVFDPNLDSQAHALNIDDVFLGPVGTVGPRQADEIPALSPLGLLALALGLGAAALQLLSRARGKKV